jgi:hypothetical protein
MALSRPCIECGRLIAAGSRCGECSWKAKRVYGADRLRGRQWQRRRSAVLRRSGGVCERCGERLVEEVHHLHGVEDNRLSSLLGVCRVCHIVLEQEKRDRTPAGGDKAVRG